MSKQNNTQRPSSTPDAGRACDSPAQGCPLGTLIVQVRENTSAGASIADAIVSITGPESGTRGTDASGKAEFSKIKPGSYTVTTKKKCYKPDPQTGNAEVPTAGSKEVTLVLTSTCWPEDYDKQINVNGNGRYFKKYKAEGTEYSSMPPKLAGKIYVPVKTGNKITVEVKFKAEALSGVTDADVTAAKNKLENGVATHWNSKFKMDVEDTECPNCPKKTFDIVYKVLWVTSGQDYTIKVHDTYPREGVTGDVMDVSKATSAWVFAHEFGHCVGLPDEYSYVSGSTETVKYIKPDGSLDAAISAPYNGKSKTAADATIMAAYDNTTTLGRHSWNIVIEVQELLTSKLGRKIKCTST